MNNSTVEKALKGAPMFHGCSGATLSALKNCDIRSYMTGDEVGESERAMLGIVISGKFVIKSSGGGRVLMNTVGAGDVFGAATVFLGENHISSIRAAAKSSVLYVSKDVLEKIMASDSAIAVAYARFLSEKIYFLNKKIISFTSQRSDAALAGYIIDASGGDGECKFSRAAAAKKLGMGRTTVYRALNTLRNDGIIRIENGKIIIIDAKKLASRRSNI